MAAAAYKDLQRGHVQHLWNYKEGMARLKGETIVFETQRAKAFEIQHAFLEGSVLVSLIAPPQWGKTGTISYIMYLMTTHPDHERMILPENVFIITGMADKDWEIQTKGRMLDVFAKNVYHRGMLKQAFIDKLSTARDSLIIIDECHFGSEKTQTVHNCLTHAGLLDIDRLSEQNIKIMCVSATPESTLIDGKLWGNDLHRTILCTKEDATEYIGFRDFIAENRLHHYKPSYFDDILEVIRTRWKRPRWHILRVSDKSRNDYIKQIVKKDFDFCEHTANARVENIDDLMAKRPKTHTFILIKQFYKAAKTFDDSNIGVVIETSKDCSNIAQGLPGRLCGYSKQRGGKAPLVYCDLPKMRQYLNWLQHGCDYLDDAVTYISNGLKIKKGEVNKRKETIVHPSTISNLDPVEVVKEKRVNHDATALNIKPRKIELIMSTNDLAAPLATKFCVYADQHAMMRAVGIVAYGSGILSAATIRTYLVNRGITANVSFKETSAKSVANLVNFYTRKEWAGCEMHIIKRENGSFMTIQRDTKLLRAAKQGDRVIAHNHNEDLVLYEYVSAI